MTGKRRIRKRGRVQKVIKPVHPSVPEKAEIEIDGADDLYKEIRIENTLEDDKGRKVKLKEQAVVDVVIEADQDATTPKDHKPVNH
jgi:hypothetical protein